MYVYLMYFVWHIKGTASAVFGNIFCNTQHYAISNPGTLRASCPEVLFSLFFLTQVHVYVRLKRKEPKSWSVHYYSNSIFLFIMPIIILVSLILFALKLV